MSDTNKFDKTVKFSKFIGIFYSNYLDDESKKQLKIFSILTYQKKEKANVSKTSKESKRKRIDNQMLKKLGFKNEDDFFDHETENYYKMAIEFMEIKKRVDFKKFGIEVPDLFDECDEYLSFVGHLIRNEHFEFRWEFLNYLYAQKLFMISDSNFDIMEIFRKRYLELSIGDNWIKDNLYNTNFDELINFLCSQMSILFDGYVRNSEGTTLYY